jgi:hypothetical protein
MPCRDPLKSKLVIAHIEKQPGPQNPRENIKFIPDTFIIDRSGSESRWRESKREAPETQKKTFPPLDSLVRPEHILQLLTLPGPSKVQVFRKVVKLWQAVNSPTSTHKDYERAMGKLSNVSSLVHLAIKQGITERVAIQDCTEILNLSIGTKACGICLAPFGNAVNEDERMKVESLTSLSELPILLPCCHLACHGCMTCWLREHSFCPCCDLAFQNVDEFRTAMEAQVRRYDYELAEVLDLL